MLGRCPSRVNAVWRLIVQRKARLGWVQLRYVRQASSTASLDQRVIDEFTSPSKNVLKLLSKARSIEDGTAHSSSYSLHRGMTRSELALTDDKGDAEWREQTRHLLRMLLREISYFPDSQARDYLRQYWSVRLRTVLYKVYKLAEQTPEDVPQVITRQSSKAEKFINMLHRANRGNRRDILRVLHLTYGRVGKRRRQLLASYMVTPQQGSIVEPGATRDRDFAIDLTLKLGMTAPLQALLRSQIRHAPPEISRAILRRTLPEVSQVNAYMKPFSPKRLENTTRRWLADTLDRVIVPLPSQAEWDRLYSLATGEATEKIPTVRPQASHSAEQRDEQVMDIIAAFGGPKRKITRRIRNSTSISHRRMRRCWELVFRQCCIMGWNGKSYEFLWGAQALARGSSVLPAEQRFVAGMTQELVKDSHPSPT